MFFPPALAAGIYDHPPIDETQAEAYLIADLHIALDATSRYRPVLASEPGERLAAIVDFTFTSVRGGFQHRRSGCE